jgi:predicted transcriptional regulator
MCEIMARLKTNAQMDQLRAEIINFVKHNGPCSGYKIYTTLQFPEATARDNLKKMVMKGELDCEETSYRKLYSTPKTIKDLPDTNAVKTPKMVSRSPKTARTVQ